MRANHFVTLGLCFGVVGVGAAVASCGTDTSGTCSDTNSCGPGSEGGADTEMPDVNLGDTGPAEGGGDGNTDAPSDGSIMCEAGLHDCNGKCVNEGNDPSNCGMCGRTCPAPDSGTGQAICDNGVCLVQCAGGGVVCNGACCKAPSKGMPTCTGTPPACGFTCDSGYHVCNGACDSDGDVPSDTGDPCILTEPFGVFVATAGDGGSDTTGTGTRAAPYATITHALANLNGTSRVYVCNGSYSDSVAAASGVGIFGGLSCTGGTWAYVGGTGTVVTAPVGSYALHATGATGVTVEDITFGAPDAEGTDASGNGNSSIAAFFNATTATLVRVTLTAGKGANGNAGTSGSSAPNYSGSVAASGSAGAASGSAEGGQAVCQDGDSSQGGAGGVPGVSPAPGGNGTAGSSTPMATTSTGFDGAAGIGGLTACNPSADPSANGAARSGGSAAISLGTLSTTGWTPSSGVGGGSGQPGQGGGGGGGKATPAVGGDAGGAGGCGGTGGGGGWGGGASIALASVSSSLTLTSCAFQTGRGGDGGPGGDGQAGQGGGNPGGNALACGGGIGGNGAGGSAGAGGTAGVSAGILWSGTQPAPTSATYLIGSVGNPGAPGGAGAGGTNGLVPDGAAGNAGASGNVGMAAQVLQAP